MRTINQIEIVNSPETFTMPAHSDFMKSILIDGQINLFYLSETDFPMVKYKFTTIPTDGNVPDYTFEFVDSIIYQNHPYHIFRTIL